MGKEKKKSKDVYEQIAHFVYETNIHSLTPRSGLWFLGSGNQSVAEHLFHTAMIAYALCHFEPKADKSKIILMALLHDIGEGRVSDLNHVHQKYGRLAESLAVEDIAQSVPFGQEIADLYKEEQKRETLEAKIVKDSDTLEWISTLRGEEVKGNLKARDLIQIAYKGLKTEHGKKLAQKLMAVHPDKWWTDVQDSFHGAQKKAAEKWVNKKKPK